MREFESDKICARVTHLIRSVSRDAFLYSQPIMRLHGNGGRGRLAAFSTFRAPLKRSRMSEITELIQRVNAGDIQARDQLFAALYRDLRRLAHARLNRSETITLLDTTSLVHDAYLKLLNARELQFADRGKFLAYAAKAMRSIVVDEIRKRRADQRGGVAEHVELDTSVSDAAQKDDEQVMRVHEALEDLSSLDARLGSVVEMRFFAGLSEADIAGALGVTERTVRRDWDKARTLLFSALK
jgi:RNA polymerase sigma factor (TIGR02999 family)